MLGATAHSAAEMLHALDHVRRAFTSSLRGGHLAGDKRDTCAPFFAEFTKISPCHILLLPDMRRCCTKNCKAQHVPNRSRLETPKSNSHKRAKLDNRFCSSRESSASRSLRRWTHATRNSRKTSGKNRADSVGTTCTFNVRAKVHLNYSTAT